MSKPMTDVDMVFILLYFTDTIKCVFLLYVFQFHTIHDTFTRIFYIQVFIPVNLDCEHWVLAQVDFHKNKVWINDSLLSFRDDKKYEFSSSGRLKLSSLDDWNMLDSTTSDQSCGVPTPGKLSQLRVCHNKSLVLAIAVFFC